MAKTIQTKYLQFSGRHATTRQQTTPRGIPQRVERLSNLWQFYKLVTRLGLSHQEPRIWSLGVIVIIHKKNTCLLNFLVTGTMFRVRVHDIVTLIERDTI